MDLTGVPTPTMDWDSPNLLETFKTFRGHAELIFQGPLKGKDEPVQITYLLLWMGQKGREIYKTLVLTADQKKSVKATADAFEKHVQPKSNPVFARFKFNNEVQGEYTMEQFITRLKILANDCSYGEAYKEDLIRDRIVFGVKSSKIREKLLTVGEKLTLAKAVDICQTVEYAQEQMNNMQESSSINYVRKTTHKKEESRKQDIKCKGGSRKSTENKPDVAHKSCQNCGQFHGDKQCKAKGVQCRNCKKWNHYARVCRSKRVNEVRADDSSEDIYIDTVISAVDKMCNQAFGY
ncbi:uncharacterized protein LOC128549912 [Mercenaria mercenaria]|uniref:uncharacterized protein LOC128549912 n=1 Tax=Mercenaria mercenaria TaxID=6596 RepID=UPI00234F1C8B|nr:uncharacterized protein LOC128549912 [Mercenaria mercenaria]